MQAAVRVERLLERLDEGRGPATLDDAVDASLTRSWTTIQTTL